MDPNEKPTVTRCKFVCVSAKPNPFNADLWDYGFVAVYSSDPDSENAKFWKYTPSGQLNFQSFNFPLFEVGKEYYLDLLPAQGQTVS